jgi:hypothetical protein
MLFCLPFRNAAKKSAVAFCLFIPNLSAAGREKSAVAFLSVIP